MYIYTSYFGNLRHLAETIVPVAICRNSPDWYKGFSYPLLAPTYDCFQEYKQIHDIDRYTKRYREEVLDKLTPLRVYNYLYSIIDASIDIEDRIMPCEGVALICYETPDKFCHRHLAGSWLTNSGYYTEELTKESKHYK